jgi:predicted GIY-YIG superfamily endonuclease
MNTVYVLKCDNDKYYVGRTTRDVEVRFQEHRNGSAGPEWTRLHSPIRIIKKFENADDYLELNKTLEYMKKYGIDKVRGGPYCHVNLLKGQKQSISTLLLSISSSCYKCSKPGHFSSKCNSFKRYKYYNYRCFKCKKLGHFAKACDL